MPRRPSRTLPRNLKKGFGHNREAGCGWPLHGSPRAQRNLKKGFGHSREVGCGWPLHASPRAQRNLKKGNGGRRGVEFSCPPAEVGGRRVAGRGSGRANGEVCTSSGSAAKPYFFTPFGHFRRLAALSAVAPPPYGHSTAVAPRRSSRSLRLPRRPMVVSPLRAAPLSPSAAVATCRCRGGSEGGKISIGRRPVCPVSFSFS